MSVEQETTTEGVQSLYSGVNHGASWERSYNADGQVYSDSRRLRQDWQSFLEESDQQHRRRALMRCYVSSELLGQIADLPIEAVVPVGNEYLIWVGQNQHQSVSTLRDVRSLPQAERVQLASNYSLDTAVNDNDVSSLVHLWGQFGWTPEAVQSFVRHNTNPIVLIRDMEREVVGVMIAESVEFGAQRLAEITELAVDPRHQGQHLATTLIREISRLSLEHWEDALVFGEYNLTTRSYQSAARAGQLSGQTPIVQGILRDHVGIETGGGNEVVAPWDTRWLHNFLVMYESNQRIHR